MKNIFKLSLIIAAVSLLFTACDKCDATKDRGKTPVVEYVRLCNPATADSLLVKAYMGTRIAIIGENLGDVQHIWFNDQEANLNPNYVTSNSIIVDVPSVIPEKVTDTMKLVTSRDIAGKYKFSVQVPAPLLKNMRCEFVPDGGTAVINGDYFIEPKVYFPGNQEAEITSYTKTSISCTVPDGAQAGNITITSLYGTTRSSFHFRDKSNVIQDFESTSYGNSWSLGDFGTEGGCSGQYLWLHAESNGAWNWQNSLMGGYWAPDGAGNIPLSTAKDISNLELKFEANVSTWSDVPMLIWFRPYEDAISPDTDDPQAHWKPWNNNGEKSTYTSDGWITVTIPMSDFIYNKDETSNSLSLTDLSGYTNINMMLFGAADAATPVDIKIDNLRIVSTDE